MSDELAADLDADSKERAAAKERREKEAKGVISGAVVARKERADARGVVAEKRAQKAALNAELAAAKAAAAAAAKEAADKIAKEADAAQAAAAAKRARTNEMIPPSFWELDGSIQALVEATFFRAHATDSQTIDRTLIETAALALAAPTKLITIEKEAPEADRAARVHAAFTSLANEKRDTVMKLLDLVRKGQMPIFTVVTAEPIELKVCASFRSPSDLASMPPLVTAVR